jgi:cytochrome P450
VRARLVAEQAAFDPAQPLRLEDLEAMPLLRQTLNEVMRIYPPVAGVFRKVEQDCSFGGWRFPAGWAVLVALGLNHNDPAVFPEPTRFDPDRFAPEAVAGRDRFAFLPFGAGPRVCAGLDYAWLETGVLAALALRTLDWRLLPGQDLSMTLIPLPRPRDGLRLALERR